MEQLDIGPGFLISPDINPKTHEQVEVIFEFNQAPAKVEVKKETLKGKKLELTATKEKVRNRIRNLRLILTLLSREKARAYMTLVK